MWTAGLRAAARLLCVVVFALVSITFAFAADPVPPSRLSGASVKPTAYMVPYLRPVETPKPKRSRVMDTKFVAMSALAMGLTIADIESTQHCLGNGTCRELNPLIPHTRAGMYAVNVPINALAMYVSYRLKASGHRTWWIAPLAISGAHGVGAGFVF
jgi:hypothetical protein